MSKKTAHTIRLGLFVTVGLALFTLAVYYIGSRQALFTKKNRISTFISNAYGLQVGNNVRYTGITVGSVEGIEFQNDSTLRVNMILDKKVMGIIKKDAVASIGTEGLVGDVVVNINPGSGDAPPVEDGDILESFSRTDPNDLLNSLGNTNENLALLSLNLLEITEKINNGEGTLPRLIGDAQLANDIARSIANLQAVTNNLLLVTQKIQPSVDSITQGHGLLGYLLHDNTLPEQMENYLARFDSLTIEETKPVIQNLETASQDIAAAANELKLVVQSINEGEGAATTILKDPAAAQDMRDILNNLNEGTARFNENMEALKHNFLFRKYFKKQEKKKAKGEVAGGLD